MNVQSVSYWIADWLRALHDNGLPANLRVPTGRANRFVRQAMLREAKSTTSLDMPFGIFKLIGAEYAPRAASAWRPRGLLLMEDLSLAFDAIEYQRHRGIVVAHDDIERLTHLLQAFFPTIGVKLGESKVRELVESYLAEHSLPDADDALDEPREIALDHPLLDELREVAAEVRLRFQSPWGDGNLIDLGLGVSEELSYSCYDWCSPLNCATFASTGVDGTHFSLLLVDGAVQADSPIVMTTPANMGKSVVVGENLFDFLCLGSRRGYALDHLADSCRSVLESLIDANWYPGKPAHEWLARQGDDYLGNMLAFLVGRLDLHPWTDVSRFDELQQRYASLLRLPPDVRR